MSHDEAACVLLAWLSSGPSRELSTCWRGKFWAIDRKTGKDFLGWHDSVSLAERLKDDMETQNQPKQT